MAGGGHGVATTPAAAVAGTVGLAYPPLAPLVLPLAGIVAASRVVLGVHHISDVLFGATLGLTAAVAACPFLPRRRVRLPDQLFGDGAAHSCDALCDAI